MFFKNYLIFLFLKFLWFGLLLGFFGIICNLAIKLFRKNVYAYNLISFCFWLVFGGVFAMLSLRYYNYTFCWFGLLAIFIGYFLVKISVEFFFTFFAKLLYNKLAKSRKQKDIEPQEVKPWIAKFKRQKFTAKPRNLKG